MLSPLTRGYGSWDGVHFDPYSDQHAEVCGTIFYVILFHNFNLVINKYIHLIIHFKILIEISYVKLMYC